MTILVSFPSTHSSLMAIRLLALNSIEPSPTAVQGRRRSRYDESALKELAANIKAVHVIEPIIVRPKQDLTERFEIVAGERRWIASRQAGLDTIPAIVRPLDDGQVLEIQLVENLHREGLHELEEAEGYETLMQQHHYSIEDVAAKIGRNRTYVYARLKLLALDKKSRDAFYAGKLTSATALLLARIPVSALQQDALKAITTTWNGQPLSFKEAQRHIQDKYMTRLNEAPFDTKAPGLIPGTGPCGSCPKLTGNQPELFGDIKTADVCTDPICYAAKRVAWGERVVTQARAEGRTVLAGKDAKRIAPYGIRSTLTGGYVSLDQPCYQDGKSRTYRQLLGKDYKADTLITDNESGSVIEVIKLSDHEQTLKAKGIRGERDTSGDTTGRERKKAAQVETQVRERILAAIRQKTPASIASGDLRLVAAALWNLSGHDSRLRLVKLWGWANGGKASDMVHQCETKIEKLSEPELRRLVIDCALIGEVHISQYALRKPVLLDATAKSLRINADHIRKTLKAQSVAKAAARGKSGKTANAKSGR